MCILATRNLLGAMVLAAAMTCGPTDAAELEGKALVMTNQLGALTRASPRGSLEPVTVYFSDDAIRMDLQDARGQGITMLLPGADAAGILYMDKGGVLPMPRVHLGLRFDPADPCIGKGMFADCQPMGTTNIAGREARHWRYRMPNAQGPGRTGRGDMWLDSETGLILRYRGEGGLGPAHEWQVETLEYGPQPASLFEVPAG